MVITKDSDSGDQVVSDVIKGSEIKYRTQKKFLPKYLGL